MKAAGVPLIVDALGSAPIVVIGGVVLPQDTAGPVGLKTRGAIVVGYAVLNGEIRGRVDS